MSRRIAVLAQDGPATRAIVAMLRDRFGKVTVILEPGVKRTTLLRRRVRKLGFIEVLGQVAFMALAHPALRFVARRRRQELVRTHGGFDRPVEGALAVPSVNSAAARGVLSDLDPDVVVVSGTRIIGRSTLSAISVPLINMHAGITPAYRGVHGGYWALAEGRPDLVGTTIHLIDEGIDTGTVLARAHFVATSRDNFATYPYLHTIAGLPHLVEAVAAALDGRLEPSRTLDLPSRLRYHPTLWGYLVRRVTAGVR